MRSNLFWLDDDQWCRIEPHLPSDVRGKERVDDRRVISGILHVLKSGCRWKDCPPEYGPHTTVYNRFARWAERGVWERLFKELAQRGRSTATQMIDSTHVKAHRSASGARKRGEQKQAIGRSRGGRNTKIHALADAKGRLLSILLTGGEVHDCPPAQRLIRRTKAAAKLLGDKAYDSAELRQWLEASPAGRLSRAVPHGTGRCCITVILVLARIHAPASCTSEARFRTYKDRTTYPWIR
jgi:transposase